MHCKCIINLKVQIFKLPLNMNLMKKTQILSLVKIWKCLSKLAEPIEFASLCSYWIQKKLVSQRKSICFIQRQNSVRSMHDIFSAGILGCSWSGRSKLSSGWEPQARRWAEQRAWGPLVQSRYWTLRDSRTKDPKNFPPLDCEGRKARGSFVLGPPQRH